mmetsp:Transcript_42740/g.134880  ORF Transcript_42740/g.134880 Transcript_42740/m.134880 type:complete len:265 (-) Transcript_42740:153-947(-)
MSPPSSSASASFVCVRSTTTSAGFTDGGHGTPQPRRKSGTCATGPQYIVSPALMSSSWWKSLKVSARGWWMVQARVRPRSANRRSEATTCCAPYASSPEVGSSSSTNAGPERSSIAMVTRRRCPPERPPDTSSPIRVSATCARSTSSIVASISSSRSCRPMSGPSRSAQTNQSVSRTVSVEWQQSSCITYAHVARKSGPRSEPFSRTSPSTTPTRLVSARTSRRVDLPQPDGPMMAVSVPGRSTPLTPLSTCSSCLSRPGSVTE